MVNVVTLSPGPHLMVVPRGLHGPHLGGDGPGMNVCLSARASCCAGAAEATAARAVRVMRVKLFMLIEKWIS